jgi:ParB/RepB/Spo0J family partition protein
MDFVRTDRIDLVPMSRISLTDEAYAISPNWSPVDDLTRSIRQVGILSPLHLEPTREGRYRIVLGFRRARAAQALGLAHAPGLVRAGEAPLLLLTEAILDNQSRGLNDLEKALAIAKLFHEQRISAEQLIAEFLPLLGIRASRFQLDRYLSVAGLPEYLQRALCDGLDLDLALRLGNWPPADAELFLGLTGSFRLGANKVKELFTLFDDLRAVEGRPAVEVWRRVEPLIPPGGSGVTPSQRFEPAFKALRRLRFPRLAEQEERYEQLKSALRLPPPIRLGPPRFFEGERIETAFSFGTAEELEGICEKLLEASRRRELQEILDLL